MFLIQKGGKVISIISEGVPKKLALITRRRKRAKEF